MTAETDLRSYLVMIPSEWNPGTQLHYCVQSAEAFAAAGEALDRCREPVADSVILTVIRDGRMHWPANWREHNARCPQTKYSAAEVRRREPSGGRGGVVAPADAKHEEPAIAPMPTTGLMLVARAKG